MIEYENLQSVNSLFTNELEKSFKKSLDSGWYILGNNVKEFENNFSTYLDTKYCAGVANGLDALILALKAFKFSPGSEVIVPSNTYIASILSIIEAGLKPILVEPDISTYNINPNLIENNITDKTVAVLVVHLYGKSCDMTPIINICNRYKLKLIEDCAQSHGAKYKNKSTGTFGDFGCFSFYPTKNLGALGDAGAVTSNNKTLIDKIKCLRNYGSIEKYKNIEVGCNSRLDELQAGFLDIKLKSLNKLTEHKRNLANIYFSELSDKLIKPIVSDEYYDVYHIFNIRTKQRNKLKEYLLNNGIKTEIHYPIAPNKQVAMKGIIDGSFPISEEIHSTTLSLPISFSHSENDILKISECINRFFK